LIPFGSAGLANTISDTHFFNRPFTSLGLVGHFEGGALFEPLEWLGVGGSGYAVTPTGEQKIYSRVIRRLSGTSNAGAGTNLGSGRGRIQNRVFESVSAATVTEESARDHGFSGWIDLVPASNVIVQLGYSRSVSYDYNSFFFSARFDLASWIRGNRD
jgi:hypothetical protein